MKKRMTVLCLLMTAAVLCAGAAALAESAENTAGTESVESLESVAGTESVSGEAAEFETETEGFPSLANPWKDMTKEELEEVSGVVFGVPEEAENVIYRWMESDKLAEMQFTIGKDEYCARIQPAALEKGELLNISGIYYYWDHEEKITLGSCEGTLGIGQAGSEDWIELCMWYDLVPGLMYSLSDYTTEPNAASLAEVAKAVYVPMQGDN